MPISLSAPELSEQKIHLKPPPEQSLTDRITLSQPTPSFPPNKFGLTSPTKQPRAVTETHSRKRKHGNGRRTLEAQAQRSAPLRGLAAGEDTILSADAGDHGVDIELNVDAGDGMDIEPGMDAGNSNTGDYDESGYWQYDDTVLADAVGFYQICSDLFIVQGWDAKSVSGTVSESMLFITYLKLISLG